MTFEMAGNLVKGAAVAVLGLLWWPITAWRYWAFVLLATFIAAGLTVDAQRGRNNQP